MKSFEIFNPIPRRTAASIIEEGRNSRIKQAITAGLILQHIINTSEPEDQITQKW
jgi:hypothetical protein